MLLAYGKRKSFSFESENQFSPWRKNPSWRTQFTTFKWYPLSAIDDSCDLWKKKNKHILNMINASHENKQPMNEKKKMHENENRLKYLVVLIQTKPLQRRKDGERGNLRSSHFGVYECFA